MSFKPEFQVSGEEGKWHRNGLVFATREEAEANVRDKAMSWWLVIDYRVVEVDDTEFPVNYKWDAETGLVEAKGV